MATHSSVLAWKIPWTEQLVGYSPWGCKELDLTKLFNSISFLNNYTHSPVTATLLHIFNYVIILTNKSYLTA